MSRSSSAVVDSKVVEMSFENSNFEKNATTSISTLQKLKEALNFTTSTDGVEKLGSSIKKVNFGSLSAGIESVKSSMSSLEMISLGYFTKVGARIEETIHKYAQMFSTIKMATDGFAEYELKMGSVQTILMSAKTKEGLPVTLDMVNKKLDELNTYADKTIYSFSDMTSSIGKFTNAGVDLDTAVAAIQGISNEAALSGANAQQASHAMYNFAQALSAGYVKLIDWKSIENANMATVDFKQTLIDTAVDLKKLTVQGDKYVSTTTDMNGKVSEAFNATLGFNDSLSAQWMTTDVLTEALGKYADETNEIGKKAFQAATEVKTFSQLLDTLKEAAGSGWAQTWELIIGDYEQSKSLFTMLSNTFGSIIDASAKSRNALLEEGLGKPAQTVTAEYLKSLGMTSEQLQAVSNQLIKVGEANGVAFKTNDVDGLIASLKDGWLNTDMLKDAMVSLGGEGGESAEGMAKSIDEISEAAKRVIRGDFTNDMTERFRLLNEEGFDAQKVQDYVNEINRLTGGTWEVTDAIMQEAAANVGLNESMEGTSAGLDDIIKKIDSSQYQKSGRELLFDALKTSIFSLKTIIGEVKGAFRDVFPPATADTVYKIARGINDASKALRRFALKNAENIRTVFTGIFKALDLILHTGKVVIGSVFKGIANFFKGINSGSGGIGAFIVKISELVSKFHDWVIENEIVEKAVQKVGDAINAVITTVKGWIDAFTQLPEVQAVVEKFGDAFSYIRDNFPSIMSKAKTSLSNFGSAVVDAFKYSKSPKEFFQGVRDAFGQLWSDISGSSVYEKITGAFAQIGASIKEFFNNLGTNADGSRNTFGKILDTISNFKKEISNLLKGVDENGDKIDLFKGIKDAFANMWQGISASGIVENVKSALSTVWTTINDFFTTLGTNSDGSLNTFGKIWTGLSDGLTWVYEKALLAKDAIGQFFKQHKLGQFFSDTFSDIVTGVSGFFSKIPDFVSGAVGKFKEFFAKVKELGGFKLSNLGDIWDAFKESVGQYFADSDILEPITTAFGNIKDRIVEKLKEFGIDLVAIKDQIVGFFTDIKDSFKDFSLPTAFQSLIDFFVGKKDEIADGADTIGESAGGLFGKIVDWVKGNDIASIITKVVGAFLLFKSVKFIAGLVKPIEQLISAMAAEKKAHANFLNKAAMIEMAVAVGIFALVIAGLSKLSVGQIVGGIGAIAAMLTLMGLFSVLVSKFTKAEELKALGKMALELSISVLLLTAAIKIIGELVQSDPASMAIGLGGLIVLMGVLWVVTKVMSKFSGRNTMLNATGLLEMVGALFGVLVLIKLLSMMDFMTMLNGLGKLALVFVALAAMMWVLKKIVGNSGISISIGIAGLAACIIALAGALWILAQIPDPTKLIAPTIAMAVVLGMLAIVVRQARGVTGGLGAMIGLALVVAALAAALTVLSFIKAEDLIAPTIAMGALIALLALLAGVTGKAGPGIATMLLMVVLVGIIAAVLYVLASLPDPWAAMKVAGAIALVLGALLVVVGVASVIGAAAVAALPAIGIMLLLLAGLIGVMALAVLLAGSLSGQFEKLPEIANNIADFMQNLSRLNDIGMVDIGPLLEALGAILGVSLVGFADGLLSIVSELEEGKTSAQMMADDMIAIADAFEHYQTTMDRVDGINIDSGPLLEAVGNVAIASLAGFLDSLASFASELITGKDAVQLVADDMAALADGFASYAETMQRFEGLEIDVTGLNDAVDAVGKASLTGFGDSIASILSEVQGKGTSVEMVASDMSALADGFSDFAEAMDKYSGVTIDVTGLNSIVDAIADISLTGFLESIGNLILGDEGKTLVTQFADDMGTLADALTDWQTTMEPLGDITIPTDSINRIKEALDSIKDGGLLDSVLDFFGAAPDYTSFTEGSKQLGEALTSFSNSLGEGFDTDRLDTAIDSIKKLTEVGVALGDVDFGGWFSDGVLTSFANELVAMTPKLNEFVSGFANLETFTKTATGVSKLANAVKTLSKIEFGNSDLLDAATVANIKKNIDTLVEAMNGLDKTDISAITKFTDALTKLNGMNVSEAVKDIGSLSSVNLSGKKTGKQLSESVASGVSSDAIVKALNKAIKSATSSADTSKAKDVGTKLGKAVSTAVLATSSNMKMSAQKLGTAFGTAISSAISKSASKARTAAGTVAKAAVDGANSYKSAFSTVGSNFVAGLANGIQSGRSRAISAAAQVAADALRAAKERLDIHSPSREAAKLGKFFDIGFANAIAQFAYRVYDESASMASLAMDGLKSAVQMASDMVLGDGENQPVITPIVDLSEIQNGASMINGIFASQRPDLAIGNLDAISYNSNALIQQRGNNDILSAIQALGDNLGTSSGDTFVINGISYDDGSNVSNAVRTLIRAVKVDRRA